MSVHFERLASDFKRALTEAVRELNDPRISPMTAVVDVEMTKDLMFAKVKVSVYDDDDKKRLETVEVLNKASGPLTHLINGKVKMRRIPHLKFVLDDTIEYSVHISKLIDDIVKGDGDDN